MVALHAIWLSTFAVHPLWLELPAPTTAVGGGQWGWAWIALAAIVLLFFWGLGGGWRRRPGPPLH